MKAHGLYSAAAAVCLLAAVSIPAHGAISPAAFQARASEVLVLEELSRVQFSEEARRSHWTFTSITARVIEVRQTRSGLERGDIITLAYRIDHRQVAQDLRAYRRKMGRQTGPQFLQSPNPPRPDDEGRFWAHLVPYLETQPNAGLDEEWAVVLRGTLYVPASYQYTFDRPFE